MKLLDRNHPFFAPVWRRWATCLLPIAWAGFELYAGYTFWGILFMGTGAYAAWVLLLAKD